MDFYAIQVPNEECPDRALKKYAVFNLGRQGTVGIVILH